MHTDTDRTLALAGIYQACFLAQRLALNGVADETARTVSLASVLRLDAEDVPAVFGGVSNMRLGLEELSKFLGGRFNPPVARYLLTLLRLEPSLRANPGLLAEIAQGIRAVQPLAEAESVISDACNSELAQIYTRTISTLRPRVIINGEQIHLQNPRVVSQIRALLLAGMRAAVLWRQCGGSRLGLWWQQARYLRQSRALLASISNP
jgi:high frequency lysogenization protein